MHLDVPGVELPLAVRLQGDPERQPLLVFGHGAGAGVDHPVQQRLAAAMQAAGLATLRYQFPFMQRQGGSGFGRDPQPVALATVRAAVAWAALRWPTAVLLAGGHSYGGRMTSLAAAQAPGLGVTALILCSYPLHPARKPATTRAAHWPHLLQPTLILTGDRDPMAHADALAQALAEGGSRFRHCPIAGADHGWQVRKREDPAGPFSAITAAVRGWWQSMAPPQPAGSVSRNR